MPFSPRKGGYNYLSRTVYKSWRVVVPRHMGIGFLGFSDTLNCFSADVFTSEPVFEPVIVVP